MHELTGIKAMPLPQRGHTSPVGLYKIFVYFKAFVHESIIRVLPPPTVLPIPHRWAFTRYSFTLKRLCTSQSFVYSPPLYCPHDCNTIARPLWAKGDALAATRPQLAGGSNI